MTHDYSDSLEDLASRLDTGRLALAALRDLTATAHAAHHGSPGVSSESLSGLFAVLEDYFATLQQDTEQAAVPPAPSPAVAPLSLVTAQGEISAHKSG